MLRKSFPDRGITTPAADREVLIAPQVFGSAAASAPLATVLVVMPTIAERTGATVETLSRADVAELLCDQCFNFPSWGPLALTSIAAIARECSGVRLFFGDLEAAAVAIDGLLR